ncbi:MAG TPA: hypothetical protein DCP51_03235 [Clostridiales bacterium]|nr:MAG: hypothetical protein A2Y40_06475 [Candidatus Margulisbacteria bacterium GWF2_35_9]HAN20680.1 hypothetical protein [Clostridiales bacterium]
MFNNNRHLNIFEHYSQANALPIENNVSRGLAIVMSENPLLLDRFIDYLNSKCGTGIEVQKHSKAEDVDIGIQQSITKIIDAYPSPKLIVGMTLTTEKHVEWSEDTTKPGETLITDIVIKYKDTFIVIEVKRNSADARTQVQTQVESLVNEIQKRNESIPSVDYINGNWEDIIEIIQQVHSITGRSENSILSHYLKHLEHRYGQWFPVSLLSEINISIDNQILIEKRLIKIIQNCCKNEDDEKKYTGRYIIPLDYSFLSEAQVDIDYDKKCLMVTVWPGDTKWQGYNLYKTTKHDLNWINDNEIIVDDTKLELIVEPYLRFAHFQSTIFAPYIKKTYYNQHFGSSKEKCLELWNDITKEWKRASWDELKNKLLNKYSGLVDKEEFNEGFISKFENSNRGYVHVSFGYEVTAYIPEKVFKQLERKGNSEKQNDKLAKFVNHVIDAIISKIV